jgi:hypothetical protein
MGLIPSTGLWLNLIKFRKSLGRRYFSAIQTSIILISFISTLMFQIISWGQSSCRIKSKRIIVFYSRKINTAQKRYTTNERNRDLLSSIETCKEYKNILLGYTIIVFTDHKNNTFNGLKVHASGRVLLTCWPYTPWRYGVTFEYLSGKKKKNVATIADALSRLDMDSLKIQEESQEVLTLLSASESNRISNIKWPTPMHTALIFKEQSKVKDIGLG